MTTQNKPSGFTLFLDKESAIAFNILANMAYETLERLNDKEKQDIKKDVEIIIKNIIEPFNEKYHEMGWCQDPHCTYDKNTKGDTEGVKEV